MKNHLFDYVASPPLLLDDLLADPVIRLVMASDRVRPEEVRTLLENARNRAEAKGFVPPAHVIDACRAQGLCS